MKTMKKNSQPNFIFIMTDEQNLRGLSCYKGTVCQTPSADRIAAEGALFENAFCVNPVCMPSRGIFMTGRYSHANGLRVNGMVLSRRELSLPEIFKSEGYKTVLFGKDHCFDREKRGEIFDRSLTAMHLGIMDDLPPHFPRIAHEANEYYRTTLREKVMAPLGNDLIPYPPEYCDAGLITTAALEFIERKSSQPFFMWLSYPGPHWPFTCPDAYKDFVPPEKVGLPPGDALDNKPECQRMFKKLLALDKASEGDLRKVISRYYGNCRYIDDQIGRLMRALQSYGLDENTIVCFTSDHGDYLGEHGLMHKSRAFYDCLMKIPFIWRWPGKITAGVRCAELVESVDFLPTVLELCGIEIPPGVQGISHAQALLGKEKFHFREAVFGEYGKEGRPYTLEDFKNAKISPDPYSTAETDWVNGPPGFMCGRIKMVRTHEWKLNIYPEGTHELYNLENDPWELKNVYGIGHAEVINELREKLLQWLIETEDPVPARTLLASQGGKYQWDGTRWAARK